MKSQESEEPEVELESQAIQAAPDPLVQALDEESSEVVGTMNLMADTTSQSQPGSDREWQWAAANVLQRFPMGTHSKYFQVIQQNTF